MEGVCVLTSCLLSPSGRSPHPVALFSVRNLSRPSLTQYELDSKSCMVAVWGPRPPQGWGAGPLRTPDRRPSGAPTSGYFKNGATLDTCEFPKTHRNVGGQQGSCPPGHRLPGAPWKSNQLWSRALGGPARFTIGAVGPAGWLGSVHVTAAPSGPSKGLSTALSSRPGPSQEGAEPHPPSRHQGTLLPGALPRPLLCFSSPSCGSPEGRGPWPRGPTLWRPEHSSPSFLNW